MIALNAMKRQWSDVHYWSWVKKTFLIRHFYVNIATNIEILGVIEHDTLTLAVLISNYDKQQLDPSNANKVKYKNNNMTHGG